MGSVFSEITIIICFVAFFAFIFRFFKQPEILAYVLTGILLGPVGLFHLNNHDIFAGMAELGVTLLLFMIGLEIRVTDLSSIGKTAFIIGPAQIIFSFIAGYLICLTFGFPVTSAALIGIAVSFSSTIIAVKILSDKRELRALYAKIAMGVLLVQDFAAILLLIFLTGLSSKSTEPLILQFGLIALKAVVLFAVIIYLSQKVFPKLVEYFSKSSEVLFLFSLAWVFGLAAIVTSPYIGFSVEIGGFLAGLALANSVANYQIIAKVRILRDFFIVIFFVLLGMQMNFANMGNIIIPGIVLSLFVLFGKPLIVMLVVADSGFRKRTSFLSGISLSQVSEFSLILIFLGNKMGYVDQNVVSLITLVAIVSFAFSPYFLTNSKTLYKMFSGRINFLENKHDHREEVPVADGLENLKDHIVVVGGDQMGLSILEALEDTEKEVVVIDFDPGIVKKLEDKKVHRVFGDISDLDIQERAKIDTAKLVVSTIPDVEDNLLLLRELQHENRKAKVIMLAFDAHEAKALYKAGADYVVLPYLAGGRQVADILVRDIKKIETLREKDKKYLI